MVILEEAKIPDIVNPRAHYALPLLLVRKVLAHGRHVEIALLLIINIDLLKPVHADAAEVGPEAEGEAEDVWVCAEGLLVLGAFDVLLECQA